MTNTCLALFWKCGRKFADSSSCRRTGNSNPNRQRLDDLYLLQSGIIDWTQFVVGRTGNSDVKRNAINALAQQIQGKSISESVGQYLQTEQSDIRRGTKTSRRENGAEINSQRKAAQVQLRALLPKKDSGDEDVAREYERVSDTVTRLTDEITDLNKEIQPIENRLQAVEKVAAGTGINETYGVRLPIVIPGGHKWSSLYYLLTGTHALHLIAGLIAMLILLCCQLGAKQLGAMENLSLYWHFVDFVWLILFVIIYLT